MYAPTPLVSLPDTAEELGIPMEKACYDLLVHPGSREKLGDITFVTATDGKHGRVWHGPLLSLVTSPWSICPRASPGRS